ncbi:MAG: thiamine phosphate synthase [Methylobacter sp.]|nr:thiamine phosphate synthase [Methylobacter sp.]
MTLPTRGLYAITQPNNKTIDALLNEVAAAIRGGAVIVQYRDKNPIDAVGTATKLLELCRQHAVPLIINDNIELAASIGADGVHLGQTDGSIALAKKRLSKDAVIGVSCYNSLELAITAEAEGASYVAFGRFFPSTSKPLAAPAQLQTLHQAKAKLNVPIVAIGGILPGNGQSVLEAGADLLAVIGGVFDSEPESSARAYFKLFDQR